MGGKKKRAAAAAGLGDEGLRAETLAELKALGLAAGGGPGPQSQTHSQPQPQLESDGSKNDKKTKRAAGKAVDTISNEEGREKKKKKTKKNVMADESSDKKLRNRQEKIPDEKVSETSIRDSSVKPHLRGNLLDAHIRPSKLEGSATGGPSALLSEQLMRLKHPLCEMTDDQRYWYEDDRIKVAPPTLAAKGGGKSTKKGGTNAHSTTTLCGSRDWMQLARTLYDKEIAAWATKRDQSATGDDKYLSQVLRTGTLSDRVAAMTLRCQESPLHRFSVLQGLIDMCAKKERKVAEKSIEAVKDLCISNLLPDRRLRRFLDRGEESVLSSSPPDVARLLILWFYEDQLKGAVNTLLTALERGVHDTVSSFKKFCMGMAQQLIEAKPEGEDRLLALLVNKLGDPDRNTASMASRLLTALLRKHPQMKAVAVREVQQYLHRPGLAARGVYGGVVLLGGLQLERGTDHELAETLAKTYFLLFTRAVATDDLRTRLLSALLAALKRTVPYLPRGASTPSLHEHVNELFRLSHVGTFATATQALSLIWQMAGGGGGGNIGGGEKKKGRKEAAPAQEDSRASLKHRFYQVLYDKIQSEELQQARQATLFLNLVFMAMRADSHQGRIAAFCKRLLQAAAVSPPNFAASCLMIISEVLKKHQYLRQPLLVGSPGAEGVCWDECKRDPCHACPLKPSCEGYDLPLLWEVALLRSHFHPSVASFARGLLQPPGHEIRYKGDPLADFSLGPFLDKMAFRHPKQGVVKEGRSRRREVDQTAFIGGESFALMPEDMVMANDAFFHKYFRDRLERAASGEAVRKRKRKSDKEGSDDDAAGEGSDDEEEKFAQKVAEDFMRSAGGGQAGNGDGAGLWGASSESESEGERSPQSPAAGDDFMDEFDGQSSSEESGDEDADAAAISAEFPGASSSSDEEGFGDDSDGAQSSDDHQALRSKAIQPAGKGKKPKKSSPEMAFASADDYRDVLDDFDPNAEWLTGEAPPMGRAGSGPRGSKRKRTRLR